MTESKMNVLKIRGRPKELLVFIFLALISLQFDAVTPETGGDLSSSRDHHEDDFIASSVIAENRLTTSSQESSSTLTILSSQQLKYVCLPNCECKYEKLTLTLAIECNKKGLEIQDSLVYKAIEEDSSDNNNKSSKINRSQTTHVNNLIDLNNGGGGVRTLKLKNVTLDDLSSTSSKVIPRLTQNTLISLELEDVTVDPFYFFNSHLLRESKGSLRTLSIKNSKLDSSIDPARDILARDYRHVLKAFASLQNFDSLIICDSSPHLAQLLLQALPPGPSHIDVLNSSLSEIYYYSFSHLHSLQSLNFSRNLLQIIPNGLFDTLSRLESLDASHNKITHLQEDIFGGLQSLKKLNLSHNAIEYVDAEVFTFLRDLQEIDLSYNEVIQFFEPYFKHNGKLRAVYMTSTWVPRTFIDEATSYRSYKEMEGLINTLQSAEILDLRDNEMNIIPETLSHAPKLSHVYLQGNPWECNCDDRWLLHWIATTNVSLLDGRRRQSSPNEDLLLCHTKPHGRQRPFLAYLEELNRHCNNSNIVARTPFKYHAIMGQDKVLNCHPTTRQPWPKITWITPSKSQLTTTTVDEGNNKNLTREQKNLLLQPNGALHVDSVTGADYGLYLCIATYDDVNITHYVHVGMDVSIFESVRIMSIFAGLISSFGFLLLVLLAQLIRWLLIRSGLQCVAVRTANNARRVRSFFDSVEQHKTSQLDWLRQNYHMQARKIQDNCISQLERIRESYTNQTKNLSEFCGYSAQQITTLRDQYQDQIRKVSSYSAHRLGRVRENYVFNRNRVCKFSSHQLLRLREAYKWQAQTLNKILENLPQGLNLDACRGVGACGRTESIYLDELSEVAGPSNRSSVRTCGHNSSGDSSEDKLEHISLLLPPEILASYLNTPLDLLDKSSNGHLIRMQLIPGVDTIRQAMGDGDSYCDHTDLDEDKKKASRGCVRHQYAYNTETETTKKSTPTTSSIEEDVPTKSASCD